MNEGSCGLIHATFRFGADICRVQYFFRGPRFRIIGEEKARRFKRWGRDLQRRSIREALRAERVHWSVVLLLVCSPTSHPGSQQEAMESR